MEFRQLDPFTTEWVAPRGKLRVQRLVRGLVRTSIIGFAPSEFLDPIMAAVNDEIAAAERPDVFHDWDQMVGYDTASRAVMTRWYARVRDDCSSVHVYTASKLVAMGVSLVAFATGDTIVAHTARAAFDEAYAKVERERQRRQT